MKPNLTKLKDKVTTVNADKQQGAVFKNLWHFYQKMKVDESAHHKQAQESWLSIIIYS